MGERVRQRVLVSGRVQGVAFRAATRSQARSGAVSGFVRNLADGRVEAVFEGAPEGISEMIAWCRRGPPAAEVRSVDVEDEPWQGDSAAFVVLRA